MLVKIRKLEIDVVQAQVQAPVQAPVQVQEQAPVKDNQGKD
jgi:hypothetical protein